MEQGIGVRRASDGVDPILTRFVMRSQLRFYKVLAEYDFRELRFNFHKIYYIISLGRDTV